VTGYCVGSPHLYMLSPKEHKPKGAGADVVRTDRPALDSMWVVPTPP
jgi:hypothetical protein